MRGRTFETKLTMRTLEAKLNRTDTTMSQTTTLTELKELQEQLDQIDQALLEALEKRFELCREMAAAKLAKDVGVMQPAEIDQAVDRCASFAASLRLDIRFLKRFCRLIVEKSCKIERELMSGRDAAEVSELAQRGVRIDHAAIAVRDLDAAIETFTKQYGFRVTDRRPVTGSVSGMEVAAIEAGDLTLVLVMGTDPQSNVTRYIENYGPGVQHLALLVDGLPDVHADLKERKANLLTDIVNAPGLRQAFTRRDSNTGMQFEFLERSNINEFEEDNIRKLYDAMDNEDVY
jgi:chorismate mutase/catechol 2,3-dioxygenase-like lactoylglutathione lyase family enzyme